MEQNHTYSYFAGPSGSGSSCPYPSPPSSSRGDVLSPNDASLYASGIFPAFGEGLHPSNMSIRVPDMLPDLEQILSGEVGANSQENAAWSRNFEYSSFEGPRNTRMGGVDMTSRLTCVDYSQYAHSSFVPSSRWRSPTPEANFNSFIEYGDVPPTLGGASSGIGMETHAAIHPHSSAATFSMGHGHTQPLPYPTTNGGMPYASAYPGMVSRDHNEDAGYIEHATRQIMLPSMSSGQRYPNSTSRCTTTNNTVGTSSHGPANHSHNIARNTVAMNHKGSNNNAVSTPMQLESAGMSTTPQMYTQSLSAPSTAPNSPAASGSKPYWRKNGRCAGCQHRSKPCRSDHLSSIISKEYKRFKKGKSAKRHRYIQSKKDMAKVKGYLLRCKEQGCSKEGFVYTAGTSLNRHLTGVHGYHLGTVEDEAPEREARKAFYAKMKARFNKLPAYLGYKDVP